MTDIRRLPGPTVDKWEWQLLGACRGEDSELFFHPEGERGPRRAAREAAAKTVCARCPVVSHCLAHSLATHEPYGVWGGLSEAEREAVLVARGERAGSGRALPLPPMPLPPVPLPPAAVRPTPAAESLPA